MEIMILMVVLIVIIAFIIFWCREFVFMMALGDSDYTGRFDKPLWFFTFFIVFLFAPFLFRIWKNTIKSIRQ